MVVSVSLTEIFRRNLLYLVIVLSVLRYTASDYFDITFLHLLFLFIFFNFFFLINMQINIFNVIVVLGFIAGKQLKKIHTHIHTHKKCSRTQKAKTENRNYKDMFQLQITDLIFKAPFF